MAIRRSLVVFAGLLCDLFNTVVVAQRDCSNATSSWDITNVAYANKVALSVAAPNDGALSFALKQLGDQDLPWYLWSCAVQWPEAWAGWHDSGSGGKGLIWSGCALIMGMTNASTYDMALSFAVDWPSRKLYLAHGFACKDQEL